MVLKIFSWQKIVFFVMKIDYDLVVSFLQENSYKRAKIIADGEEFIIDAEPDSGGNIDPEDFNRHVQAAREISLQVDSGDGDWLDIELTDVGVIFSWICQLFHGWKFFLSSLFESFDLDNFFWFFEKGLNILYV